MTLFRTLNAKPISVRIDALVLAIVACLLAYGRWASIVYPAQLNPDEAQAAANTLRIKAYGFNWDVLDGTTVGPLNSVILSWPHLFGWDVTFSTTRLTAYFLLWFVCSIVYFSISLISHRLMSILFLAPLVIFYSFTGNPEFLHYSSEVFPLSLLILASYLAIDISLNRIESNSFKFTLLGLLVGSVPFAKLQASPIALTIGSYALFLAITSASHFRTRNVILLAFGALLPAIAILLPLYFSGHILDFWRSYIVWAGVYIKDPTSILAIHSMIASDIVLKYIFYFIVAVGTTSLLHATVISRKDTSLPLIRHNVIYLALLLLAVFFAIAMAGNSFLHYLMFLPPFVLVFFGYTAFSISETKFRLSLFVAYYVLFSVAFIYAFSTDKKAVLERQNNIYKTILDRKFSFESPQLLSWIPIPSRSLLIWGWMPQWYVSAGLTPASRESHTYGQIANSKLTSYFRTRFLNDIASSKPELIIDGVKRNSFVFNDSSKYSPEIFPEFADILSTHYTALASLSGSNECPEIFVRNEYKKLIDSRLITPASIYASDTLGGAGSAYSPSNLFDLSVTEDSCIDYWLLPDNKVGSVDVTFSKPESISALMLLNTQNSGFIDRSTEDVMIRLHKSGSIVLQRAVKLRPYPYWTVIDLYPSVEASGLEVDILSFEGLGAGLNEIKVFRSE